MNPQAILDEMNTLIQEIYKEKEVEDAVNWARVKAIDVMVIESLITLERYKVVEIMKVSPEATKFYEALDRKWKARFPNELVRLKLEW